MANLFFKNKIRSDKILVMHVRDSQFWNVQIHCDFFKSQKYSALDKKPLLEISLLFLAAGYNLKISLGHTKFLTKCQNLQHEILVILLLIKINNKNDLSSKENQNIWTSFCNTYKLHFCLFLQFNMNSFQLHSIFTCMYPTACYPAMLWIPVHL